MGKIELVNKEEFLSGIKLSDPIFNSAYFREMYRLQRERVVKELTETLIEINEKSKPKMKSTAEKIAVMQAYEEGKKIITFGREGSTVFWKNENGSTFYCGSSKTHTLWNWAEFDYSVIEDESIVRAYRNAEEVIEAIKKHGGYVKEGNTYRYLKKFTVMENGNIVYSFSGWNSTAVKDWDAIHAKIVWADGAPFGVKIKED